MAITVLPESTVHILNSAQVLTTPTSLIKELVDNALGAKATSVDVAVLQNTLDRLEVKDNGHGIAENHFFNFISVFRRVEVSWWYHAQILWRSTSKRDSAWKCHRHIED
ncbi:hypothetical protein BJ878DRAFT_550067 [Calycina marina]|uniref:Uncharacterized protein n=1 Tax=Calycina marina TaxID=1763456 RepID=A0A9P8CIG3_9HELO|nr:hypothetical protein BJ878DRAFT_550067 [Calycina marina]